MNRQPILQGKRISLRPMVASDFEPLFSVASDPKIWEQHPVPDRYKRDVFRGYFDGAMESGGGLLVTDPETGRVLGATRIYDFRPDEGTVVIGYTFIARELWGTGANVEMKRLLLDHCFQWVDRVHFHVGTGNIRSQKAMLKIGARLVGPIDHRRPDGTPVPTLLFVYSR